MTEGSDKGRLLRQKERKIYTDQDLDDDEIDGKRTFSVDEKLVSNKCNNANFIKILKGTEFNLKYIQEHGFSNPILIHDKTGLGMRLPSQNFKVSDVKQCVGSRRMLDVVDVNTQKGLEMSMKEWVRYYENEERDRLLNVISLEFSHTRLENYVEQPEIVRQIDWVDCVWPRHLKDCQTETTNILEKMKYPKVQKYCLMSVKGCYTDFHIDFGGTSVWYHILHGEKIFWMIPPTPENLDLYEEWTLSGKQGDMFFADRVKDCQRAKFSSGDTLLIPGGWIHAVFTPKDSLVFGGNFIHSFNIPMQLRVLETEDKTHVPQKFRYPFLADMLWYVLERYVSCLTGKNHRQKSEEELKEEKEELEEKMKVPSPADLADDRSNDSRASEDGSHKSDGRKENRQDELSPRSPMDEENFGTLKRPKSPKSPKPLSPKLSRRGMLQTEEMPGSPKSPKVSMSEPKSPKSEKDETKTLKSAKSSKSDGAKAEPLAVRKNKAGKNQSEEEYKNKNSSAESRIPFHQSDIIKPVSVKLENCLLTSMNMDRSKSEKKRGTMYMTPTEVKGLWALVEWIEDLPPSKRNVPKDIPDPDGLLRDVKKLLTDHANVDHKLAATGELLLKWPSMPKKAKAKLKSSSSFYSGKKSSGPKTPKSSSSQVRRRRTRCKKCEPCTRPDCGECHFCKDMKKYGGPGRMKQCCVSKQCMAPVLPNTAVCMICGTDEPITEEGEDEPHTTLMECGICWEIVHPQCLKDKFNLTSDGVMNEDLPNSWECSKCCTDGKQGQLKPRTLKGGAKRTESRVSSTSSDSSMDTRNENEPEAADRKRPRTSVSPVEERMPATPENREDKKKPGPKPKPKVKREGSEEQESPPKKKTKLDSEPRAVGRPRKNDSPSKQVTSPKQQ